MSAGNGMKQTVSLCLPTHAIDWLDASAKSQSLSSRSKAVRCCINCVALGDVGTLAPNKDTTTSLTDCQSVNIELASEQIEWIESQLKTLGEDTSQSEVVRSVVKACMGANEELVYGVIRCKSKVSACDGAQEASNALKKRYGENIEVKEEIKLL